MGILTKRFTESAGEKKCYEDNFMYDFFCCCLSEFLMES